MQSKLTFVEHGPVWSSRRGLMVRAARQTHPNQTQIELGAIIRPDLDAPTAQRWISRIECGAGVALTDDQIERLVAYCAQRGVDISDSMCLDAETSPKSDVKRASRAAGSIETPGDIDDSDSDPLRVDEKSLAALARAIVLRATAAGQGRGGHTDELVRWAVTNVESDIDRQRLDRLGGER